MTPGPLSAIRAVVEAARTARELLDDIPDQSAELALRAVTGPLERLPSADDPAAVELLARWLHHEWVRTAMPREPMHFSGMACALLVALGGGKGDDHAG